MTSKEQPSNQAVREVRSELPSAAEVAERLAEGWKLQAVEWTKERPAEDRAGVLRRREIPYGLRISQDRLHLEEEPREVAAMILMLSGIADDEPLSRIAELVNAAGHRPRSGGRFTQLSIFNLLPRLIEVGPDVYSSVEWEAVRARRNLRVAR